MSKFDMVILHVSGHSNMVLDVLSLYADLVISIIVDGKFLPRYVVRRRQLWVSYGYDYISFQTMESVDFVSRMVLSVMQILKGFI